MGGSGRDLPRVQALNLIEQALAEVREGIRFANGGPDVWQRAVRAQAVHGRRAQAEMLGRAAQRQKTRSR